MTITYKTNSRGEVVDLREVTEGGPVVWEKANQMPDVFGNRGSSHEPLFQVISRLKMGEIWWATYDSKKQAQRIRDSVYRCFAITQARSYLKKSENGTCAVAIVAVADKPKRRKAKKA